MSAQSDSIIIILYIRGSPKSGGLKNFFCPVVLNAFGETERYIQQGLYADVCFQRGSRIKKYIPCNQL